MKMPKSVSRRISWLFSLMLLFSFLGLLLSTFHTFNEALSRTTTPIIGSVAVMPDNDIATRAKLSEPKSELLPPASAAVADIDSLCYVIKRSESGSVEVVAYPEIVTLYDLEGSEVDSRVHLWRAVALGVESVLFGAMFVLIVLLALDIVRGNRVEGLIFTRRSVRLIRVFALLLFFYILIDHNLFSAIESWVIGELYSDSSPLEFTAYLRVSWWMLVLPLLFALFAELMKIANMLNEEECDTL